MASQSHSSTSTQKKEWILVGNSLGSLCNLAVAAAPEQWPPRTYDIKGMVLFNSAGGMTGFRYQDLPAWAHPIAGHAQYFLLNRQFFHGPLVFQTLVQRPIIETVMKNLYTNQTHVDDDLIDILLQPAFDEKATDVFLNIYTGPAGPTRESLLSKIQKKKSSIPILCLWGSDDSF
ncbi:MAG: hypothetical protein SGARI_005190, partial [Bacillariaceae sp.]